ncbi:helix-turn-helix domain-containing protein [Noviherbaspirillum denitrificans]|uniref:DNA-binding protein n=1 Tax=Noviherbaspirillum denitrificans TaxID=1968433 RepID=A0A254TKA5_9BURK|nr:XRE family transcriptional regulator [Noviherbaspirillum denitrificans]OWW20138.1 DNA-binding protein [Noviherbaspirillum denitrificans]
MDINAHIAQRVLALRKACGYTLDGLAERSGVSRSMISLIERGQSSPTAAVLDKLAAALDVTLATLFSDEPCSEPASPLARRKDQPLWKDPASGYVRRNVSPRGFPTPIELVEVVFPPHQCVAFDNVTRDAETHQQVWVLEGAIDVTAGSQTWHLEEGDCVALQLEHHTVFHNQGDKPARYVVALSTLPAPTRKRSTPNH